MDITIENNAVVSCFNLTPMDPLTVPEGITHIRERAFHDSWRLRSIRLPESLYFIGDEAFAGCYLLEAVQLPERIHIIGKRAFAGCSSLTSVNIPLGVQRLEEDTFRSCTGLTHFSVPEAHPVFSGYDGLIYTKDRKTLLLAPSGLRRQPEFPPELTALAPYSLRNCTKIRELYFPERVKNFGTQAFPGLKQLVLGRPEGELVLGGASTAALYMEKDCAEFLSSFLYRPCRERFGDIPSEAIRLDLAAFMAQHHPEERHWLTYLKRRSVKYVTDCIHRGETDRLERYLPLGFISEKKIDELLDLAAAQEDKTCYLLLMNYKEQFLGYAVPDDRFTL